MVDAGVAAVRGLGDGPVRAAIGPCICVRHYEFGADALAPLVARFGDSVAGTTTPGILRSTSPAAAVALDDAGVDEVTDVSSSARSSPRTTTRTGAITAPVARPSSSFDSV